MTRPGVHHGNLDTTITVSDGSSQLELATHFTIATSEEGFYLYFGKVIPPEMWTPSTEPKSDMQVVAKLFLSKPTMSHLRDVLNQVEGINE